MSTESEESIVEARDPLLGLVVQDRYRVVRKLGEGGMGRVYEGEHLLVKRRVAIKCLHAQFASNAEVLQRFLREAQAASAIGNEHIVDVMDMGRLPDGAPFMVMEFLEGRSLGDVILEDGPLPVGRAVRIMRQICAAVEAAHAKSIVHRDLKPDNVFLIKRGDDPDFVKVLDFGIAKFLNDASGARTGTGVMVGTISFMAPEQVEGLKDIDHRADLYALGGILYTALTQRLPFEAESIARLAFEVCMVPAPDVRALRPDLPVALGEIVQNLLAKSPAERLQRCAALRDALAPFTTLDEAPRLSSSPAHALALGETLASAPGFSRSPSPPKLGDGSLAGAEVPLRQDRSWSRWAGVGLGVLVLGAGLAVGLTRKQEPLPRPVTEVIPSSPPATPAGPAGAGTVHVFVQVTPETATLLVDGRPVANPWDVDLPVSTTPRHIEARAEGYEPWSTDITLEYPQRVNRALRLLLGSLSDAGAPTVPSTPIAEPGRSGRHRSRSARQDSPEAPAAATPSATSTAPPTPSPAPTPAARPPRGQLMNIDPDEQ